MGTNLPILHGRVFRSAVFAVGNGRQDVLHQIVDLALLANGMLKGKALSEFISRSQKVVSDAYLK